MKVFFLDFSSHKRSGSTDFLIKLLGSHHELTVHYASGKHAPDMCNACDMSGHDILCFLQISPGLNTIRRLRRLPVFIPMFDGDPQNPWKWRRIALQGGKAISFSSGMTTFLRAHGVDTLAVKYYPPVDVFCPGDSRKLFLWERGNVFFRDIKKFFKPCELDEVVIRHGWGRPQPIPEEDVREYHVKEYPYKLFEGRDVYRSMFADCGLYVAPRKREGIGMSFLEAMAMGKCVIAHDGHTMNEYIENGVNGVLVDFDRGNGVLGLDSEAVSRMQVTARESSVAGRKAWEKDEEAILSFLEESERNFKPMGLFRWIAWLLLIPLQLMYDIRTMLRGFGG